MCILDLLVNGTTINLDFENVVLLLSQVQLVHLSMDNDSHDGAVLSHSVKLELEVLGVLSDLLVVLGEGLLLGVHPILVESSEGILSQLGSPDGGKGSESSGSLNVSDDTNNNDGRGFDDGDGFYGFLTVELGSWSVDGSQNVSHTSLETSEGSQVDRLSSVVTRE